MRWFIEVSRIGDESKVDKACVEAKAWQLALQEVRKQRGDAEPLGSFSIELLDDGYRAVDPSTKLRYSVRKAPADAPLTGDLKPTVVGSVPPRPSNGAGQKAEPVKSPAAAPRPPAAKAPDPKPKPKPAASPPAAAPAAPPHKASAPALSARDVGQVPEHQLFKSREEEPTEKSPITYREHVYAVKPGTSDSEAEMLLWTRFAEVAHSIEDRPAGKFIQLAAFDHVFDKKPARPPLATLAWKDWRGEPTLKFPAAKKRAKTAKQDDAAEAPAAAPEEQRKDSSTAIAAVKKSVPPGRRKADDDLIGELFEAMHELHFMADVVAGCEFVLEVMKQAMPAEGMLIQVFDINSRNFVVVRAQGAGYADVLMHQTPDTDQFLRQLMRSSRTKRWDIDIPAHFSAGAWEKLKVGVKNAMLCPSLQGGRYLGIIEMANPVGGGGFHDSEANALEYICEQFAEFLSNRPIVVDAEAVMPHG